MGLEEKASLYVSQLWRIIMTQVVAAVMKLSKTRLNTSMETGRL